MNKLKLDSIVEQYADYLQTHGVAHLEGFKIRLEYFNDKLEKLAKDCNVSPFQYLDVLDSNWRELYEFQEMPFYTGIIRHLHDEDVNETKILIKGRKCLKNLKQSKNISIKII